MALRDVFLDELRDLYSAENQLVKALPELAKGAKDGTMKKLFAEHLEETKGQVQRLQQIFEMLEEKPTGKHCNGMEGLIEEGQEALEEERADASFDLGLAGGALRVEHYEIAGYEAVIAMARTLDESDCAKLLKENLQEEVNAAKKITEAAKPLLEASAEEPEEEESKRKTSKEKTAERKSREDERKAAAAVRKG